MLIYRHILIVFILLFVISIMFFCESFAELGPRGRRFQFGGAYAGISPSMPLDGSKIAFGSTRYGLGDICTVNSDGKNWTRLTHTFEYEGEPCFSPKGDRIAFVSERHGYGEIYIMNCDGTNQLRLTNYPHYDASPSFSPDGSKILFSRNILDPNTGILFPHIFLMNCDGSNISRITHKKAYYYSPKFSFDGKKIVFRALWPDKGGSTGIGIIDIDTLEESKIIDCFCFYPSFSQDSRSILFVVDWGHGTEDYQLCRISLLDRSIKRIFYPSYLNICSPSYIQKGNEILFLNTIDERGGEICIMNEEGNNIRRICKTY